MEQTQGDAPGGMVRSAQMVLAFAAITGLLYYGRPVLLPFVLAVFIFSMFSPTLDWLVLRLRFSPPCSNHPASCSRQSLCSWMPHSVRRAPS